MGTTTPAPTLTDSCPTSESLGPDNRLHPLSTGADHGIDELPGVPRSPGRRARRRYSGDRAFVVNAVEIERSERIVFGSNDVEAGEAACELLEDVAKAGRFEGSASCSPASPRTSARVALSSCGRATRGVAASRMTCSAPAAATSSSTRVSAAGRSQRRCVSPRRVLRARR